MSKFEKRQVRLPAKLWEALDAEVEEAMGTITYHWLIAQALEARYRSELVGHGDRDRARPTVSV